MTLSYHVSNFAKHSLSIVIDFPFLVFAETSIVIIVAIALAIGVIILSFGLICLRWSVYTVFVIYRNYMISQNRAPFDF